MTSQYPESAKMAAVSDESQSIGEFIEWLGTKGIMLGHNVTFEGYSTPQFVPVSTSTENLLADYFEIDLKKVEQEKRAMLEAIRHS